MDNRLTSVQSGRYNEREESPYATRRYNKSWLIQILYRYALPNFSFVDSSILLLDKSFDQRVCNLRVFCLHAQICLCARESYVHIQRKRWDSVHGTISLTLQFLRHAAHRILRPGKNAFSTLLFLHLSQCLSVPWTLDDREEAVNLMHPTNPTVYLQAVSIFFFEE